MRRLLLILLLCMPLLAEGTSLNLTTSSKDTDFSTSGQNPTSPEMWSYEPASYRNLVGFDVTSIPATATVSTATMSLFMATGGNGGSVTVSRLFRGDWVESEITWTRYKVGSNWTTAGGDFTTTDQTSFTCLTNNSWGNIVVTNMVQTAVSSQGGQFSTILRNASNWCKLHSKEGVNKPKLSITYTEASSGAKTIFGISNTWGLIR